MLHETTDGVELVGSEPYNHATWDAVSGARLVADYLRVAFTSNGAGG